MGDDVGNPILIPLVGFLFVKQDGGCAISESDEYHSLGNAQGRYFDVPVRDEAPVFHGTVRLQNIRSAYAIMRRKGVHMTGQDISLVKSL
jgi:hypothetical protein